RSKSSAAARSIDRTTSANSTVTCLYSADRLTCVTGAPHSLQNLECGDVSVPHDSQESAAAVSAPRPSPVTSTSVWCQRRSAMSATSTCHLRDEVSKLRTSPSRHRVGPGDVPFEAKRFPHRAIAIHQVSIGGLVAASPGEQRAQPQQRDLA